MFDIVVLNYREMRYFGLDVICQLHWLWKDSWWAYTLWKIIWLRRIQVVV